MVTIPAETTYSDVELEIIATEPPGLFPSSQSTVWGQIRKVFADYMQANFVDIFTAWYNNLDPRTVDASDISEWEYMVGLVAAAGANLQNRQAAVVARMRYGPFTRTNRQAAVEAFLGTSFGAAVTFTPTGVPFDPSGLPLYSGVYSLAGAYTITEDIPNFSYTVAIDPAFAVDVAALTRALTRITPAGYNFVITHGTVTPTTTKYGDNTYGSNTYGG